MSASELVSCRETEGSSGSCPCSRGRLPRSRASLRVFGSPCVLLVGYEPGRRRASPSAATIERTFMTATEARATVLRLTLSIQVPAGPLSPVERGLPSSCELRERDERVPDHSACQDHARARRPALVQEATGACRGSDVRRWRSSRASARTTTPVSSAAPLPACRRPSSRRSRVRCSSTRPSARISSILRARRARLPDVAAAPRPSASGQVCSACSTR